MNSPTAFGFYGQSNTGKTTLITEIIKHLTDEGFNVATVKNTDKNIGMDVKGKDTWKHSQAGSKLVVLSSPTETDFVVKSEMNIEKILLHINNFQDCDVVLIEGAKDPSIPKIRLGDNTDERENTILSYNDNLDEIIEKIKGEIAKKKDNKEKKVFVKINGKHVPLSGFPSTFIKRTIIGMMGSLKGIDNVNKVEIYFES
jgi:molybdopterin-guanine dinucleotide biosynthesis protein MobB